MAAIKAQKEIALIGGSRKPGYREDFFRVRMLEAVRFAG